MKKLSIGIKIAVSFGIVLLLLLVIGLISFQNLTRLKSEADWVAHTQEVLAHIEEVTVTQTAQWKIVKKTEKEKEQKLQQIDRLAQQITKNIQTVSGLSPQITLTSLLPSIAS